MRVIDTSVKDICASASAGRVIVLVGGASLLTVRDAAETPGGTVLVNYTLNRDYLVLLDVFDLVRLDMLHDASSLAYIHLGGREEHRACEKGSFQRIQGRHGGRHG